MDFNAEHVLHALVFVALVLAAVTGWRRVSAESKLLGAVLAAGFGIRLCAGLALFAISYFDLGIMKGLHTGGGFWALAPDASEYYGFARDAVARQGFGVSG